MSDYHREKVLRIPMKDMEINSEDYDDIGYDLWEKYGDIFYWNDGRVGRFDVAPTEGYFLDFVLEEEYGADCGEWGKVRALTPAEVEKYTPVFRKLYPYVDMSKVHLVEYCWYNCSEAPDYYSTDKTKDPFYQEIPFICNFTLD